MTVYEKIIQLQGHNTTYVLATVVKTEGSVPGKVGFKIIVESEQKTFGTVGGGALEQRVIQECVSRMKQGNSGLLEYLLSDKPVSKATSGQIQVIPMMCEGKIWIYYEVNQMKIPVYLFGGGHVGQALAAVLSRLNYHIRLVDNREEFANHRQNPDAHECTCQEYAQYASVFKPPAGSFIIVITHGHTFDYDIIRTLYQRKLPLSYVGVIASRSKSVKLIQQLKKDLGEKVDLSSLYTPVGLDIGGETPAEIALSIAAELQAIRFGKKTPHLRQKTS